MPEEPQGIALVAVGVAALVLAGCKLLRARRSGRRPPLYCLVGALASLGLSAIVLAPASLRMLSGMAAAPNIGRLLGNGLAMVAAWCIYQMNAGPVRNRPSVLDRPVPSVLLLVACVAAMSVLLLVSGAGFTVAFVEVYGARPAVAAYEAVYCGYLGWVTVEFVRVVRPWARKATGSFRAGLVTVMGGAAIATGWAAWKLANTALRIGGVSVGVEGPVSAVLAVLALAVALTGVTLTRWAPLVLAPVRAVQLSVSGRVVRGFAAELQGLLPELRRVSAVPPFLAPRRFRPYLATVVVRDAEHHIRRYVPRELDGHVRALHALDPRRDLLALQEAARFVAALQAFRAGHAYYDASEAPTPRYVRPDLLAEVRAIATMVRAVRRSPVVWRVRDEVLREVGADDRALVRSRGRRAGTAG